MLPAKHIEAKFPGHFSIPLPGKAGRSSDGFGDRQAQVVTCQIERT